MNPNVGSAFSFCWKGEPFYYFQIISLIDSLVKMSVFAESSSTNQYTRTNLSFLPVSALRFSTWIVYIPMRSMPWPTRTVLKWLWGSSRRRLKTCLLFTVSLRSQTMAVLYDPQFTVAPFRLRRYRSGPAASLSSGWLHVLWRRVQTAQPLRHSVQQLPAATDDLWDQL